MLGFMEYVRGTAVRWLGHGFPGHVEVRIATADGDAVRLVDKAPVFDAEDRLTSEAAYPIVVHLPCEVIARDHSAEGSEVATVRLSHGVADQSGRSVFRVAVGRLVTDD
jgi:hypothetical protein